MNAAVKSERIQLRASSEAKAQILEAASLTQQDATSFILDAATSRARAVLLEQRLLKLTPNDLQQIEQSLDQADAPSPQLRELFAAVASDTRLVDQKVDGHTSPYPEQSCPSSR